MLRRPGRKLFSKLRPRRRKCANRSRRFAGVLPFWAKNGAGFFRTGGIAREAAGEDVDRLRPVSAIFLPVRLPGRRVEVFSLNRRPMPLLSIFASRRRRDGFFVSETSIRRVCGKVQNNRVRAKYPGRFFPPDTKIRTPRDSCTVFFRFLPRSSR